MNAINEELVLSVEVSKRYTDFRLFVSAEDTDIHRGNSGRKIRYTMEREDKTSKRRKGIKTATE